MLFIQNENEENLVIFKFQLQLQFDVVSECYLYVSISNEYTNIFIFHAGIQMLFLALKSQHPTNDDYSNLGSNCTQALRLIGYTLDLSSSEKWHVIQIIRCFASYFLGISRFLALNGFQWIHLRQKKNK